MGFLMMPFEAAGWKPRYVQTELHDLWPSACLKQNQVRSAETGNETTR